MRRAVPASDSPHPSPRRMQRRSASRRTPTAHVSMRRRNDASPRRPLLAARSTSAACASITLTSTTTRARASPRRRNLSVMRRIARRTCVNAPPRRRHIPAVGSQQPDRPPPPAPRSGSPRPRPASAHRRDAEVFPLYLPGCRRRLSATLGKRADLLTRLRAREPAGALRPGGSLQMRLKRSSAGSPLPAHARQPHLAAQP